MTSHPLAAAKMATAEFDPGPLVEAAKKAADIRDEADDAPVSSVILADMRFRSVASIDAILAWGARDAGMAAEVARLQQENSQMREALRPFAEQADDYDARFGDPRADDDQTDWPSFSVATFRAARAALAERSDGR
jgi:hypothetical protein